MTAPASSRTRSPASSYTNAMDSTSNIERWSGAHRPDGMSRPGLHAWERLLDLGVDAVAEVLASRSPRAVELRANSPFAGVLEERLAVHRSFRRHWAAEHPAA